jgi:hypothetical protein
MLNKKTCPLDRSFLFKEGLSWEILPLFYSHEKFMGFSPTFFHSLICLDSGKLSRPKILVFSPFWGIWKQNGERLNALSINKNFFDFLSKILAWMKLLATFNSKW